MRWFIAGAAALLAGWLLYLASPYWALWRLASALEARDGAAIAERVNTRALRLSLARQIAGEGLASRGAGAAKDADAQLAASALAVAADELLAQLATPERLAELLIQVEAAEPEARPGSGRFRPALRSLSDVVGLVGASRWRGFRNLYVVWPPAASGVQPARAQLRFSRLSWRLVSLDLPPDARRRLLDEVARRYGLPIPN